MIRKDFYYFILEASAIVHPSSYPPAGNLLSLLFLSHKTYCSCLAMHWLNPQYHDKDQTVIVKPEELESNLEEPPKSVDKNLLDRIRGSMIGLALGDALGAHVEFRPHQYLDEHPVTDLQGGGTWGLKEGQVI